MLCAVCIAVLILILYKCRKHKVCFVWCAVVWFLMVPVTQNARVAWNAVMTFSGTENTTRDVYVV